MQSPMRVDPLAPQAARGQQTMNYQQEQKQELHQGIQQHAMELHGQLQRGPKRKTLWIGGLKSWMDASYLRSCFGKTGHDCTVKIIRSNKAPCSKICGFVGFESNAAAQEILQKYNGQRIMPRTKQPFVLNWAFEQSRNPASNGVKVVKNSSTGRSKGNGSVRFGDETERDLAMTQMNGVDCSRYQQPQAAPAFATDNDPSDTTIFLDGLDVSATDDDLRAAFSQFGDLAYVKIEGCGFVQFNNRASAVEALQALQGKVIGQQPIRLAWLRSLCNTLQVSQDFPACGGQPQHPNHGNGEYYGYQQEYEGYESAHSHDPGKGYTHGSYPGYGNFYQQQSGSQDGIIPVFITNSVSQDPPGGWGQPQYPNVWNGGYYGNQQGPYNDYGAQFSQFPGAFAYSSHPGYGNYGQHSDIQVGIPRVHTYRNDPGYGNYRHH